MPRIDVIFPEGALDDAAKARFNATLWKTALHWEGIERTEAAASVAWVFLDERPKIISASAARRSDRASIA